MSTYVARLNGTVIARSDQTVEVEGNQYFPPSSVDFGYLDKTETSTVCPWKGTAGYYTVSVDGDQQPDAAWTYADPSPRASQIKDHVAFWKGVSVGEE